MELRKTLEKDPELYFNLVQVGVTVGGCILLFVFMVEAAPSILYIGWELFWRAAIVAFAMGFVSLAANSRYLLALHRFRGYLLQRRSLVENDWRTLEQAVSALPFRLFLLTFILWIPGVGVIALWSWTAGLLRAAEAWRLFACGLLYSPIQGLIIFYLSRYPVRILMLRLQEAGRSIPVQKGRLGIKGKLLASSLTLAVIPFLAGLLISQVQDERVRVELKLDDFCKSLEIVHAEAGLNPGASDFAKAAEKARSLVSLPRDFSFLVSDEEGRTIFGRFELPARKVWRELKEEGAQGECLRHAVPGRLRFVVLRYFHDPGLWIAGAGNPYPPSLPFWSKAQGLLGLGFAVLFVAMLMGWLSAREVARPIEKLTAAARKTSQGRLEKMTELLPDDELSELALGYNALVEWMWKELGRSRRALSELGLAVEELSRTATAVKAIGEKQRGVIDEHASLAAQSSVSGEKVTKAAGIIKERADAVYQQMKEVSSATQSAHKVLAETNRLLQEMAEYAQTVWKRIETLEENYHRIDQVVKIIDDIAEREEILALNARLEAAAKAESGERMAVVAADVQRLSERIGEQTVEIKRLVKEIRRTSLLIAQEAEIGKEKAAKAPEWADRFMESIAVIEKGAESASRSMEEIVKMAENQRVSLQQLQLLVSEIKAASTVMNELAEEAGKIHHRVEMLAGRMRESAGV